MRVSAVLSFHTNKLRLQSVGLSWAASLLLGHLQSQVDRYIGRGAKERGCVQEILAGLGIWLESM